MIQTLQAVIPVIGMIFLGAALHKYRLLSREGIDAIKFLVSRIMLPVAIFHALSNATYNTSTLLIIVVMLVIDVSTFLIGFVCRGLVQHKYRRYLPYIVSLYEGGMLAYPLFSNLAGAENLASIAMIDISGLLFGFSIYMGMLQQMESGEKISAGALLGSALRSPAFIGTVLGVISGLTGAIVALQNTPAGAIYLQTESMLTAPLNMLILLAVGYDLAPDTERLAAACRAMAIRFVIQAAALSAALFAIGRLFPGNTVMKLAAIMYMCVPTTFSMQTYIKDQDGSKYVSTTNSLYCIITIVVYAGAAFLYNRGML